jgi:hypothetical protein
MSDVTNCQRATWAYKALVEFASTTGQNIRVEEDTVIQDLLTDLMHLCRLKANDENGLDFDVILKRARSMHKIEVKEDRDYEYEND